jgi:RHS repeat-associated protein
MDYGAHFVGFTGKERDSETGLDFFAARYMSSAQGRFTSPDPSNLSVDWMNPQSWNRYAYVGNNPPRFVDNNGLWWEQTHNLAVKESLPGLLPDDLKNIYAGSKEADSRVMGMDSQSVPMSGSHSMSSGDDIGSVATSMALGDRYASDNQAEARVEQAKWVAEGHTGFSPKALQAFGRAQHPGADSTSPSHENQQTWGGCQGLPIHLAHLDCLSGLIHSLRENPYRFSGDRKAQTIVNIQLLFLDTFGEAAYQKAIGTSEADRKSSHSNCLMDRNTGQCAQ